MPTRLLIFSLVVLSLGGCQRQTPQETQAQTEELRRELESVKEELRHAITEKKTESAQQLQETQRVSQANTTLSRENASLSRQLNELQEQARKQRQASEDFLKKDGELEVTLMKTYQEGKYAYIDFTLTNRSEHFIETVGFGADIFDSAGGYLGHYDIVRSNLRPQTNVTASLLYENVSAARIATWKPAITQVKIGGPGGARIDKTRNFTLRETRP
jgi:hypothetical protein